MRYTDIIAREADGLSPDKKAEVLDFIEFIKERQGRTGEASTVSSPEEIEAFFRNFNVNTSGYKFDRDDAVAR